MNADISAHRTIILIHGLGRGSGSMLPLGWYLRRAGFDTHRIDYPSTRAGIDASERRVREAICGLNVQRIDLVGHSLGGVLAARLLREPEGMDVGHVVQLGAPNLGSPLSSRLGSLWPVRQICGPAAIELNEQACRRPTDPRIAAIAGTGGFPGLPIPRPHDGAVSVRSAWSGAGHRSAVPVLHTALPISPRAARLTVYFLRHGRFPETPEYAA